MPPLNGVLVSSFNSGNFARYLENDETVPTVTCSLAPFGQVMATLLAPSGADRRDFAVVWTCLEHISASFAGLLEGRDCLPEALASDVDAFSTALRTFAKTVSVVFVPTWTPALDAPAPKLLAMRPGIGRSRLLMEMNLRLADNLRDCPNIYLLDCARWLEEAPRPRDAKLWYLGKIPFANEVFVAAVHDIKGCLRGLRGGARKLLLLDLDDTLWGGLVGDVGWEKLRLGGHDPSGEAYVDFQRALKALSRRGIVLGVVSKNEEAIALEVFERHPEMVLRRDDLAGWRINRQDKARNIVDLVHELNLGLDAVVFIDDSAVERARVRETLPEVLVPEWPGDSMLYTRALAELRCFELPAVTAEDSGRTRMYNSERSRSELLARVESVDEWLKSLELRVEVEEVSGANFERVLQLLNKTNQMNLSTRRMTDSEFRTWLAEGDRRSWCFRVTDRFGDSGITGLLSLEHMGATADIKDFVLSCRVMGRKIEETMLHVAVDYARSAGLREIRALYEPTPRNQPCLEFLKRAGFPGGDQERLFVWSADRDYPLPDAVTCSTEIWRASV